MGQISIWHLRHLNQHISLSSNNRTSIFNNSIINNLSNNAYNGSNSSITNASVNRIINNESSLPDSSILEQLQNFSIATAEKLSYFLQSTTQATSFATGDDTTPTTATAEAADTTIWSNWLFLLIIICITIGGVFGNASLIMSLYTQSSARLRNPLLVGLCVADLMVTGVSAPLTIVTLIMITQNEWIHSSVFTCKSIYFMQVSIKLISIEIIRRSNFFGG